MKHYHNDDLHLSIIFFVSFKLLKKLSSRTSSPFIPSILSVFCLPSLPVDILNHEDPHSSSDHSYENNSFDHPYGSNDCDDHSTDSFQNITSMIELQPASVAGAGAPCGKEEPCLTILSLLCKKNLACGATQLIFSLWCKEIYPQIVVPKNILSLWGNFFIRPSYIQFVYP